MNLNVHCQNPPHTAFAGLGRSEGVCSFKGLLPEGNTEAAGTEPRARNPWQGGAGWTVGPGVSVTQLSSGFYFRLVTFPLSLIGKLQGISLLPQGFGED